MKLSLRNLALGATLCVAGAAMAQDGPFTVEKNWYKAWPASDPDKGIVGYTNAEYRYGTGFGGKVYATNKTAKTLSVIDANGITDIDAKGAVSVNATHDDAGNILFKRSWANAETDVKNWAIYNPTNGEITELDLTSSVPEKFTPGRMDVTGRVIGNVLSEEGGLVIFACGKAAAPYIVKIAGGKAAPLGFTDYPQPEYGYACDTSTIGQFSYTYDEVVEMGDDWPNAVVMRKRGNKAPAYYDAAGETWTNYTTAENASTMDGFDIFTLGDKTYIVVPAPTTAGVHYTNQFAIVDVETGEKVYQMSEAEVNTASGQGFGTITANKVNDYTVEIYIVGMSNAKNLYAGMWTVKAPEPTPTVYLAGDFQGWAPETAVEMTLGADGLYTYTFTEGQDGKFKMSTAKGDWTAFNAACFGAAEDKQTYTLEIGKPVALAKGKIGDIALPGKGNWTITLDYAKMELTLTGEAAKEESFTVTKNWYNSWEAGKYTLNEYRFGTGFGGKVYATNKTTKKLSVIDEEGIIDLEAGGAVSVNATHDDAGNILFKRSWANAGTDVKNWAIYNPNTGEITELDLTAAIPEGLPLNDPTKPDAGRMDVTGRAIGNVLSEEGGLLLFAPANAQKPYLVKIVSGQAVPFTKDDDWYAVPDGDKYGCDSSTIAQFKYTYEEVLELGDWSEALVVRKRGNKAPSYLEGSEWKSYKIAETTKTTDGFDVFTIGEKTYIVVPTAPADAEVTAYTNRFAIMDAETGEILYQMDEPELNPASGQCFNSITANKIDDKTVEIYVLGMSKNNNLFAGMWTVKFPTVDPVEPDEPVVLPQVYLRGEMNDWAAEGSYMFMYQGDIENPTPNQNGEYEYKLYLDAIFGDFKLGGLDWKDFDYGAKGEDPNITASCTKESWAGSSENFKLNGKTYTEATINFFYNPDPKKPSYLKFEGTEYVAPKTTERAHFAYGLEVERGEGVNYTVKFKSTGDALKAVLVLTEVNNAEAAPIEVELGEVKAGENSFPYSAADLTADKKYHWAIELHNYEVPETKVIKSIPTTGVKYSGAIVTMLDDQYPSFGYTIVAEQVRSGFDVYAPDGTVKTGVYKNHALLGGEKSTNGANPIRGAEHMGHALFGAWGDDAYGVTAFDPANLDADLYSVFEGEKDGAGACVKDGVKTGSGTSGVGVSGKGKDAILVTFDEDILGNKLAMYPIGENRTIGYAPVDWGFANELANHNVDMVGTSKGFFVAQVRGEGNSRGGCPGAAFITRTGEMNWICGDFADETLLTSSTSGVAVNKDETLVAFSSYTQIYVMALSWDGEKPVIDEKPLYVIPFTVDGNANWATMRFDAANNLHVYFKSSTVGGAGSGYNLYVLADKEPVATTNAPAKSLIANGSGVENVAVDAAEGEAVYYNLNGVRVAADNLTPGIYVKVVGKTATKVVVK